MSLANRPLGLKIIVAYKVVRAALVLALALWMTLGSGSAIRVASALAHDISEGGATLARLGAWIERHVTSNWVLHAAVFAWLDAAFTAAEAFLLYRGRPWGEWIVVAGLTVLVPFEALALERRPSALKLGILVVNTVIVAYLVYVRLQSRVRRAHP